jgi:RNA polymerase sigma-70 factor (ECF subfamily)
MSILPKKFGVVIEESVVRVLSRADDARGLSSAEVKPRVEAGLAKYLFRDEDPPQMADVKSFINELRADDLCLIIACERGDEKAWEDLVTQFDATVRSAARKIAGNNEDADDLASSIWAELYGLRTDADGNRKSKLGYYSGRGSLGGWLRAVVSQLAIDQFRKQSKLVQVEEDRDLEILVNDASPERAAELDPENRLTEKSSTRDISAALSAAMAELPAEDRLILKLYYFDDLKLNEIAASFGYLEATASRRLARIQKYVRASVEKHLKTEHGWNDAEVNGYLSETAAGLGMDVEKLLAAFVVAVMVQDLWR